MSESPTYLGFYDPDRKRTVVQKIMAACERYREKFGQDATVCLCSLTDDAGVPDTPILPGLEVHVRGYIATNTFYVGRNASSELVEMPS